MQPITCPTDGSSNLQKEIEEFNEKVSKSACDAVKKNLNDSASSAMIVVAVACIFFISSISIFPAFPLVALIVLLVGGSIAVALGVFLSMSEKMGCTLLGPLAKVEINEQLQKDRVSLIKKIDRENIENNRNIKCAFVPLDWDSLLGRDQV